MRTEPIFVAAIEGDPISREVEALAHAAWEEGELCESAPASLVEAVSGALGRDATPYEIERANDCWKLHVWEHEQALPLGWYQVVRLYCQRAQAGGAKSFSASVRAALGAMLSEKGWSASEQALLVASKVWSVTKKSGIEPAEKPLPFDPETGEVVDSYPSVVAGEPHPHPEEWHNPRPAKPAIVLDGVDALKADLRQWANEQARKVCAGSTPSSTAGEDRALEEQVEWRGKVRELSRLSREVQEITRRKLELLDRMRAIGEEIRRGASGGLVFVDGGSRAIVIGKKYVDFLEVDDET